MGQNAERFRRAWYYQFSHAVNGTGYSAPGLDQWLILVAVQRSLAHHSLETRHCDQLLGCAATTYTQMLEKVGAGISMAQEGGARPNGQCERLTLTIKVEAVSLSDCKDFAHALRQLGRFLNEAYRQKLIHCSLGHVATTGFQAHWQCPRPQALFCTKNPSESVRI